MLTSLPAQVYYDIFLNVFDRVDPSTSPCGVQMYFIKYSLYVGRVIFPLRSLASIDNTVDYLPVLVPKILSLEVYMYMCTCTSGSDVC